MVKWYEITLLQAARTKTLRFRGVISPTPKAIRFKAAIGNDWMVLGRSLRPGLFKSNPMTVVGRLNRLKASASLGPSPNDHPCVVGLLLNFIVDKKVCCWKQEAFCIFGGCFTVTLVTMHQSDLLHALSSGTSSLWFMTEKNSITELIALYVNRVSMTLQVI